jgi:hypothetical protein
VSVVKDRLGQQSVSLTRQRLLHLVARKLLQELLIARSQCSLALGRPPSSVVGQRESNLSGLELCEQRSPVGLAEVVTLQGLLQPIDLRVAVVDIAFRLSEVAAR